MSAHSAAFLPTMVLCGLPAQGTPRLVADLRPPSRPSPSLESSDPSEGVALNGRVLFAAGDLANGEELWSSDGTAAGTMLVQDMRAGRTGSFPRGFMRVGNLVFFVANDGWHNSELWVTDGTTGGTRLVRDIAPGPGSAFHPGGWLSQVAFQGRLFFAAQDPLLGFELWESDGTESGTQLLRDIAPGVGQSFPEFLAADSRQLCFSANDGTTGIELWVTDGTPSGTREVTDIRPGIGDSYPFAGVLTGGLLFFTADDGVHGRELWASDGTQSGTQLVVDLCPGPQGSQPSGLMLWQGQVYFVADDGVHGQELWILDPRTGGTTRPGVGAQAPLVGLTNRVVFLGGSGAPGRQLWGTDGSTAGTTLIRSLASAYMLGAHAGRAYLRADDGQTGSELWASDGTPLGTVLVADLEPGSRGSYPSLVGPLAGGAILFAAETTALGRELWLCTGSAGATLVRDINSAVADAMIGGAFEAPLGAGALFGADDGLAGNELWFAPNSQSPPYLISDIVPGVAGSGPRGGVQVSGRTFLTAEDSMGSELWVTDGSPTGTRRVKDIFPGRGGSQPTLLHVLGNRVVFVAIDGNFRSGLWSSDGTEAGTILVKEVGSAWEFTPCGSGLELFANTDGVAGRELWRTDGTSGGTVMVADLYPGPIGAQPFGMTRLGNRVLFGAMDPVLGVELWISDGTAAGTTLLADIEPGPGSSFPGDFAVLDGIALFAATQTSSGRELWRTDGTAAGTFLVHDIAPGLRDSNPNLLRSAAGGVYFFADHPATGLEPWWSDGTPAGTFQLADVRPGVLGSLPADGAVALVTLAGSRRALFLASDGLHGVEWWVSDGTPGGTRLHQDLRPGPGSARIQYLTVAGSNVWFAADDGVSGQELWAMTAMSCVAPAGGGCSGQNGRVPRVLAISGSPFLGNLTFGLGVVDARGSAPGVLMLGSHLVLAPVTNTCLWPVDAVFATLPLLADPAGNAQVALPIPLDPALSGSLVVAASAVLDSAGAFGFWAWSAGMRIVLGWD